MKKNSIKSFINKYTILLILIFAFTLRFYKSASHLPLYWEEAALGYDAYSIYKTGKDYHGNFFPIISFPSFGDYKPSLYFYSIVPFISVFGLNELVVRLPSILSGTFAVFLIYLISKKLKLGNKVSLLSALLLTISPWHLQFSRVGFEVNLATTIFLVGLYFLLSAREKSGHIIPSAIFLSLSMYAYHGFRIVAPISALLLFILYFKSYKNKSTIVAVLIAVLITLPILLKLNTPQVSQRLAETSHFTSSNAVETTNELRSQHGNTLLSRTVFHRYWWWTKEIFQNYSKNFSPNFLFLIGDGNSRHQTGEFGLLYHWEIITVSLGILLLTKNKSQDKKVLIYLLLITPLATMLTKTNPHTLRMLPASVYFSIISAYGLNHFLKVFQKNLVIIVFIALLISLEFVTFSHFYLRHYKHSAAKDWQYGYKQVFEYLKSNPKDYQNIYITRKYGRPSIYALFFNKTDPSHIQSIEPGLEKDQLELLEFDKYIFKSNPPSQTNSIYVISPEENYDSNKQIHQINYPSGEPVFILYETQ